MKQNYFRNLIFPILLCIGVPFSSCTIHDTKKGIMSVSKAAEQSTNSQDAFCENDMVTAEAYESNEEVSKEEQVKDEEVRRSEIAEQYTLYEPYGMTYNKEKDRFFYKGKKVRYFKDVVNDENTNAFFFDDGAIDVEPIRDTNGALAGLQQSSKAHFQARSKKQEQIKAAVETSAIMKDGGSFELGDPYDRDHSLDAYTEFGVCYDKSSDYWLYGGKVIRILYDANHQTYYNNGISDGVNLKVIRDKNGNIEKLVTTKAQELEQYVK